MPEENTSFLHILKEILLYTLGLAVVIAIPIWFHWSNGQLIAYGLIVFFGWVSFMVRYYVSGLWRVHLKQYESALTQFEKASRWGLNDAFRANAAIQAAHLHMFLERPHDALKWCETALNISPNIDHTQTYLIQASVYLTLQQPLKILQACDLAAKQTPQSSQMAYQLHNQRVMAYGMLIDLSRGEAELAALSRLESTPEFAATTTYARAYLYTQCEQYDRAISYGEQAAALLTPVDLRFVALITLAYAYTHTGQFDLAQSCLDRADALEFPMSRPNYALLVLLGRLRLAWQQNQPLPEGSAQLEALKPHLADHQLCYVALGQAFIALQEGRYPAAVSHLNNALHRIPAEHRQLRVDVFYMLGLAHYHLHHINEWSKACEEIKAMAPQSLKLQSLLQLRSDTL